MLLLATLAACRFAGPDGADSADTAADTADPGTPPAVGYTLEEVASGSLPEQATVSSAMVNPLTGVVLALDEPGTMIRYLQETYVHPTGDYCAGGTVDESGVCRGGIVWTSGRIESPTVTVGMCLDEVHGELYLLKAGGEKIEVIDVSLEGDEPYSYLRAVRNPKLPLTIAEAVNWTTACAYQPDSDTLLLGSAAQGALAELTVGATPTVLRTMQLGFAPGAFAVGDEVVHVRDLDGDRVVELDGNTLGVRAAWQAAAPLVDVAFAAGQGRAWAATASTVVEVRFVDHVPTATPTAVTGVVAQVVADPVRPIAWALADVDGAPTVHLIQAGAVRQSWPVPGRALRLAAPSATGDVPVFWADEAGAVQYTVLGPVEDAQTVDPLRIFLFTTIEEPSDANMADPCTGAGGSFASELALVRNNARVLAGLGVPIAMAITDNFAEKAEECGETGIYQELADYGFELGAMLHNRPCYNCTSGGADYNPDLCQADDPDYIAPSSGAACFPDDPEYCGLGDWDCYHAFLAPRVDVADRNIPGGARFIVGGDRHGMWSYDWVRLYREVERPTLGLTGFDLTLFAGTWAYNVIDFDDPRGKNPAPWRVADRTAAWHLADIDHWDQDSPTSPLLYLSGGNSATVKLAEQQASGLYMLDFFEVDVDGGVAYRPDDYEAQWQWLRSAVANRKPGALNTWYFHIHDTGTLNLRDANDQPITVDPDGDGPMESTTAEAMLAEFVARIRARYDGTGAVEWATPSEIRALDPRR